jgi:Holliday junction DNA helicase RuvA
VIAYLRGRLESLGEDHAVIDVGGVGYLVVCAPRTLASLPRPGEVVELRIETQLRAESLILYGFETGAERSWFRLLQTVQGVGARVALAVLSVLAPAQLAQAVLAGDKAALARASGVGPRLAARMVSELQARVGELPAGIGAGPAPLAALPAAGGLPGDAVSALVNLGYGRSEAHQAVGRAAASLGEAAALPDLIRAGLKELAALGEAPPGQRAGRPDARP